MSRDVVTVIDGEKCIGCGLCVSVCPSRTLSMVAGKAKVTGKESMQCGHCEASCPTGAVRVPSLGGPSFKSFSIHENAVAPGDFDTGALVNLMASRRSCRNYLDKPVDRKILEDLVEIGITAPSGTNSQGWTFTIIPTREGVLKLGNRVADFFRKLNRTAEKAWLRKLLGLIGKKELETYYRSYHRAVGESLAEWENDGVDRLFHGAVAAIVVGGRPSARCPAEDALLATQNILLAAHSMGLGTCLVGFVTEAAKRDPGIGKMLGIPRDEGIYTLIALGYPDEKYIRPAGRFRVTPRWFE